ncbi:MAG TPA: ABC transporter ATP-binding protein [Candidatus Sulfotelmatobacter sp.]|nr:ABC transporter ATP-binding protein [Candidatus Sulfotelmatobacter sp.]
MTAIRVADVSKTFRAGSVRALDRVSLEIRPGETFGIIGPNGAGKTTLLGCLLGLLRHDSGEIALDGHPPDDLAVRRQTGYLPERLVLDRWMTGLDFLAYHHALAELDPASRATECQAALERVGLDPSAGRQAIRRYSRGMLQRLGLAQALLGTPRFVFLDEPISGVDPAGVMLFRRLLLELKSTGATVIINSHQLDEVERLCDRVAFVRGGQVQSIETVSAGAELRRVLAVRWAGGAAGIDQARLAAAAAQAGAALASVAPPTARFSVADDAGATRLLQALLGAGVPIVEAAPEGGRLERLFESPSGAAGAPPAGGTS